METATIRAGLAVGTRIAEYFGLIETVSTQVDKLVHQALRSALDNLKYAQTAEGNNRIHYIKRAMDKFNDAMAVEENESKVMVLCGLSICQYFLCDDNNAERTMNRIKDVELTRAEKNKAIALDAGSFVIPGVAITREALIMMNKQNGFEAHSVLEIRKLQLETIKTNALALIRQMLIDR